MFAKIDYSSLSYGGSIQKLSSDIEASYYGEDEEKETESWLHYTRRGVSEPLHCTAAICVSTVHYIKKPGSSYNSPVKTILVWLPARIVSV